jgi:hypothetical protein
VAAASGFLAVKRGLLSQYRRQADATSSRQLDEDSHSKRSNPDFQEDAYNIYVIW